MDSATKKKKSVNLSVDSGLLDRAKAMGLNLSQTLEARLAELTRAEDRQRWLEENQEAIEAYNERVRRRGIFADEFRRF